MENPLTGIDALEKIADPAERARQAGDRLDKIPAFQTRLRKMRQAAVLEMRASGMSYAAIAGEIGLHRNRVQQIAEGRTAGGQGGDKAKEAEAAREQASADTTQPPKRRTPRKSA